MYRRIIEVVKPVCHNLTAYFYPSVRCYILTNNNEGISILLEAWKPIKIYFSNSCLFFTQSNKYTTFTYHHTIFWLFAFFKKLHCFQPFICVSYFFFGWVTFENFDLSKYVFVLFFLWRDAHKGFCHNEPVVFTLYKLLQCFKEHVG